MTPLNAVAEVLTGRTEEHLVGQRLEDLRSRLLCTDFLVGLSDDVVALAGGLLQAISIR